MRQAWMRSGRWFGALCLLSAFFAMGCMTGGSRTPMTGKGDTWTRANPKSITSPGSSTAIPGSTNNFANNTGTAPTGGFPTAGGPTASGTPMVVGGASNPGSYPPPNPNAFNSQPTGMGAPIAQTPGGGPPPAPTVNSANRGNYYYNPSNPPMIPSVPAPMNYQPTGN